MTRPINRYRVVVVSKYLGMYRARDPLAYMIADSQQANACIGRKYDSRADAETEAQRLNTAQEVQP